MVLIVLNKICIKLIVFRLVGKCLTADIFYHRQTVDIFYHFFMMSFVIHFRYRSHEVTHYPIKSCRS